MSRRSCSLALQLAQRVASAAAAPEGIASLGGRGIALLPSAWPLCPATPPATFDPITIKRSFGSSIEQDEED